MTDTNPSVRDFGGGKAQQSKADTMDKDEKPVGSGTTTPEYGLSTPSSLRKRSNSQETVLSTISEGAGSVAPSIFYPNAPVNSPYNRSLIGDTTHLEVDNLAQKLEEMPVQSVWTPPGSVRARRESGGGASQTVVTQGTDIDRDEENTLTPTQSAAVADNTPTKGSHEDYFEHQDWGTFAEEDVSRSLKRLAVLAGDLHKKDKSKTVEQHYSELLSNLIQRADVNYDCSALR